MSTLEKLYCGDINPCDRSVKHGSEYERISNCVLQDEKKLLSFLNQEEKELYENVSENKFIRESISEKETFINGFRLGAQIMLEILSEPEKQLI